MQFIAGLLGAIIGAAALVALGLIAESYKRHRDRVATAAAIAAEISTQIAMVKRRDQIRWFRLIEQRLAKRRNVVIPNIVGAGLESKLDPVVESLIDRLGLLGHELTEGIVTYYSKLRGIRVDIVNLSRGTFDHDLAIKAALIGDDLKLWEETEQLGNSLAARLRHVAQEEWEPFSLIKGGKLKM